MTDTWVTPRVWVAGEKVTASKKNEDGNNFRVLWPYTATGDIAYKDGAGAYLSKVAKPASLGFLQNDATGIPSYFTGGSALQHLQKNAGNTAFEWAALSTAGALHASGIVTSTTQQATSSTSLVDVTLMTTTLTLTKTCTIIALAYGGHYLNYGWGASFAISIDGTVDTYGLLSHNSTQFTYPYSFMTMWRVTGVAAGSRVVKLKFMTDNAGETLRFHNGRMIALAFAET